MKTYSVVELDWGVVCLLAATVGPINSPLARTLGCHCVRRGILQSLPVSCHFRGCKATLSRIVSGAMSATFTFTFLPPFPHIKPPKCLRPFYTARSPTTKRNFAGVSAEVFPYYTPKCGSTMAMKKALRGDTNTVRWL